MADLGSIGVSVESVAPSTLDHIGAHSIALNPIGAINPYTHEVLPFGEDWGVLSGNVIANGAGASRTIVLMRQAQRIVDTTVVSDGSGAFSGRVPYKSVEYVAIAIGGAGEAGAIFDKVVAT